MADSSGVGTIQHVSKDGRFGFIKLDDMPGVSDLFVFPPACEAFGREVPPVGTRVMFNIVTDEKTGRPRADCVQPAGGDSGGAYAAVAAPHEALPPGRKVGIMTTTNASFGFIRLENGEPDMFCLPPLPPPGARVSFETVMDAKTGRPRAENVHVHVMDMSPSFASGGYGRQRAPAPTPVRSMPYPSNAAAVPSSGAAKGGGGKGKSKSAAATPGGVIWQPPSALPAARGARRTGTVTKVNASFAFIQQDCGEADMFLIPPSCEAFGRELPPVGTRIAYDVIADRFTGRPRAENAEPALGGCGGSAPRTGSHAAVERAYGSVRQPSSCCCQCCNSWRILHWNGHPYQLQVRLHRTGQWRGRYVPHPSSL
eukprot:TRINITY_DN11808_c0_g1_i2.p1 TRINITY_DN11808_c0_g1~~TRINITY_DN11808_c0_g1_i2.p1  ORF type:complete len:396 (-),score=56.68 TRINITY_DN11808_c0_g1_i2:267-1373(-)